MKGWDPEWRCFSLVLKDRTVDFACLDESDTIACILGLQSAVRGPKGYTLLELRRHINRIKAADDNTKAIASLKPWGRSTLQREAGLDLRRSNLGEHRRHRHGHSFAKRRTHTSALQAHRCPRLVVAAALAR